MARFPGICSAADPKLKPGAPAPFVALACAVVGGDWHDLDTGTMMEPPTLC